MNTSNYDHPNENNPVYTPTPPQVMDPSQHRHDEEQKDGNKKRSKNIPDKKRSSDKNKEGNEKLTPKEEL
jgi:hypothetical protein